VNRIAINSLGQAFEPILVDWARSLPHREASACWQKLVCSSSHQSAALGIYGISE